MGSSQQALEYVATLPSSSHAILYYNTDRIEAEVFKAYFEGARDQRQAVHVVSRSREHYENLLRHAHIDFAQFERDDAIMHIPVDRIHSRNPTTTAKRIVKHGRKALRQAQKAGYNGLRIYISSDRSNATPASLLLEKTLGRDFPIPISLICSYNVKNTQKTSDKKIYFELIKAHGHVIFQGLAGSADFWKD